MDNWDRFQKFADSSHELRAAGDAPRIFYLGAQTLHREDIFPLIDDRSFEIAVSLVHNSEHEGVLRAIGDPSGGMVLNVEPGHVYLYYNGLGDEMKLPSFLLGSGAYTRDCRLGFACIFRRDLGAI